MRRKEPGDRGIKPGKWELKKRVWKDGVIKVQQDEDSELENGLCKMDMSGSLDKYIFSEAERVGSNKE